MSGARPTRPATGYCPRFHRTVELLGRRWTGAILLVMQGGGERFGAIRDAVPGLSDRLLVARLRELEAEGVVVRHQDCAGVRYCLTEKGRDLRPVIAALSEWTERWTDGARPDAATPGGV